MEVGIRSVGRQPICYCLSSLLIVVYERDFSSRWDVDITKENDDVMDAVEGLLGWVAVTMMGATK